MKITKTERARHNRAETILQKDKLDIDDRLAVLELWHEGFSHDNAGASAFFTPYDLAMHLDLNVSRHGKLLDLCAGIGSLSVAVTSPHTGDKRNYPYEEHVLLEINPDYCEVARKLLPHAEVICGSIYDDVLMDELATRGFDQVISNPPFGNIAKPKGAKIQGYSGEVHFEVIALAARLAEYGVFILPQMACPFTYSGKQGFSRIENARYTKFSQKTGIELELGVATDTSYLNRFRGTHIVTEIVTADFTNTKIRDEQRQQELFAA